VGVVLERPPLKSVPHPPVALSQRPARATYSDPLWAAHRLRVLHLGEGTSRPLAALHALVQRWREVASLPQWKVDLAWLPGLLNEKGIGSLLIFFPRDRCARIVIDPTLDEPEAERALMVTLAQLQLRELDDQIKRVRRRRRFPE
jgi:hypothetical protein